MMRDDERTVAHKTFAGLQRSHALHEGDVILALVGATIGNSAVVERTEGQVVQRDVAILRPRKDLLDGHFLNWIMMSDIVQSQIRGVVGRCVGVPSMSLDDVGELQIVYPSLAVQRALVEVLKSKTFQIDAAIDRYQQELELLREFRACLVADVVTGQLDVRVVAAVLPDEPSSAFVDEYDAGDEDGPDRLHDLKADLDSSKVYTPAQIGAFVEFYQNDADCDKLDPILDACVLVYRSDLDEDEQADFKAKAKAFLGMYASLSCVLPHANAALENLFTFLDFLVAKLPADRRQIDLGALAREYELRHKRSSWAVPASVEGHVDAVGEAVGGRFEPNLDRLSNILRSFNDLHGHIPWNDRDRVARLVTQDIPAKVAVDEAFQNAKSNSDEQNARIENEKALTRAMLGVVDDDTQLFKQYADDPDFKRWLSDAVFRLTYHVPSAAPGLEPGPTSAQRAREIREALDVAAIDAATAARESRAIFARVGDRTCLRWLDLELRGYGGRSDMRPLHEILGLPVEAPLTAAVAAYRTQVGRRWEGSAGSKVAHFFVESLDVLVAAQKRVHDAKATGLIALSFADPSGGVRPESADFPADVFDRILNGFIATLKRELEACASP